MNSYRDEILEYIDFIELVSLYSKENTIGYLAAGYAAEMLELSNLLTNSQIVKPEMVLKEAGDCIWFLVSIGNCLSSGSIINILDDVLQIPNEHEHEEDVDIEYIAAIQKLSEPLISIMAKHLRGDRKYEDLRQSIQVFDIGVLLNLLNSVCTYYGYSLIEAMRHNRKKLVSRFDQNLIKGDGDIRTTEEKNV